MPPTPIVLSTLPILHTCDMDLLRFPSFPRCDPCNTRPWLPPMSVVLAYKTSTALRQHSGHDSAHIQQCSHSSGGMWPTPHHCSKHVWGNFVNLLTALSPSAVLCLAVLRTSLFLCIQIIFYRVLLLLLRCSRCRSLFVPRSAVLCCSMQYHALFGHFTSSCPFL